MTRRIYPALTRGQVSALEEAANERAAGCPEDSGGLPARRYDEAAEALAAGVEAEAAVFLSRAEARALARLVDLAHANLQADPDEERRYRTSAAERAWAKLEKAAR